MMDFLSHGPAVCTIMWHFLISLVSLGTGLMCDGLDLPLVRILQPQPTNRHCCPRCGRRLCVGPLFSPATFFGSAQAIFEAA